MDILQWMGARSRCCNAPWEQKSGWNPHTDGWKCSQCKTVRPHNANARKRSDPKKGLGYKGRP